MADRLDISQSHYSRLEKDEAELSIVQLERISQVFEMRIEDVLSFDEKIIFSNNSLSENATAFNFGTIQNGTPEKLIGLYEDKIKLLEEKILLLEKLYKN